MLFADLEYGLVCNRQDGGHAEAYVACCSFIANSAAA